MELATIVNRYRSGESSVQSNPDVTGISDVKIVTFENGDRCVIKTQDRCYNNNEMMASLIGQALGFNVPQIVRLNDETIMMNFIDGATGLDEICTEEERTWMGIFDYIIKNDDRHDGNWMREQKTGDFWYIDHGFCFSEYTYKCIPFRAHEVLTFEWIYNAYVAVSALIDTIDESGIGSTANDILDRIQSLYSEVS